MYSEANIAILCLQLIGGHIGIPLLIFTFIFMRRRRSLVVVHFCISWIIFSISNTLLLYGPTPLDALTSQGICLLAIAAADGSTAMTTLSTFNLLLHLYLCLIRPAWFSQPQTKHRIKYFLSCTPYVLFFIFFFQTYAWSAPTSGVEGPNTFSLHFCTDTGLIWAPGYFFAVALMGLGALLDILIVVTLIQKRSGPITEKKHFTDILIRMSLFTVYRTIYMVLYIVVTLGNGGHIKVGKTELSNLSQVVGYVKAANPLLVVLILGTKSDVLEFWGIKTPSRFRTHYTPCQEALNSGKATRCTCEKFDDPDELDDAVHDMAEMIKRRDVESGRDFDWGKSEGTSTDVTLRGHSINNVEY
ncbi:hypothetical protein SISNIDRAFT_487430 [Sistotremastrum niveocremeum HHB9708]|uniref:G-protein coupled receptors family 1 profile domain-containing protein n=1 Tax=Sistotremastrum niveocremeum HHB9708 TaxID=1314777 RepID=A0A164SGC7_9AGAM|nr:hypothetical protein SISNIDRAFT_487430 [Sistotremastrum niveocremeum HHB9708]